MTLKRQEAGNKDYHKFLNSSLALISAFAIVRSSVKNESVSFLSGIRFIMAPSQYAKALAASNEVFLVFELSRL